MNCPHCNKRIVEPKFNNAELNAEFYGSNTSFFQCSKCKKKYSVYFENKIIVHKPEKAPDDTDLSY